jgi:predicted O-methyltransferase YrrM
VARTRDRPQPAFIGRPAALKDAIPFEEIAEAISGIPYMSRHEGKQVYDHIRNTGARDVLELGTSHGASSAYMAAALGRKGGRVTTVDRFIAHEPTPEETHERGGVADRIELVRIPHSSYVWWLKDQVAAHSDEHGNCEPQYDFCYLDGAHNFTVDGLAVILVERLLRPGGWLLLDDVSWSYESSASGCPIPDELSLEEQTEPHIRAVLDLIVKPHPAFTDIRVQGDWWAWARKTLGEPRRYRLGTTRRLTDVVLDHVGSAKRRLTESRANGKML